MVIRQRGNDMSPRRVWLAVAAGGLLVTVVGVAVWGAHKVTEITQMARDLKTEVVRLDDEISVAKGIEDLPETSAMVETRLTLIDAQFAELRAEIRPYERLLTWLRWVPEYGDDAASIPPLLDLVEALLVTAHQLKSAIDPSLEYIEDGGSVDTLVRDLPDVIGEASPAVTDAERALAEARTARGEIEDPARLVPELREVVQQADDAMRLIERGLGVYEELSVLAPALLGEDAPHHILILVQNADELRPTGGWITSTVYLVMSEGGVETVDVIHSNDRRIDQFTTLRYEEPPAPLRDVTQLPIWAFRDANWSPDFPSSANKAIQLYTSALQRPVDTVVAINQYSLAELLRATGPLALDSGAVITADNAAEVFRDLWTAYVEAEGAENRKEFITDLSPILIQHLLHFDSLPDALARWQAVRLAADSRDLLVYSTIPVVQSKVEQLGWGGSIPTAGGDYLYVTDSNIGINKTDLNVERRVSYHVSLARLDAPYSQLEVAYINHSAGQHGRACPGGQLVEMYEDVADDCYVDYLRLYLPDGTTLLAAPQFVLPDSFTYTRDPAVGLVRSLPDERGKEVFGGLMVVLQGQTLTSNFTFSLPPEEIFQTRSDGALVYRLLVAKQPGVPPSPFAITIDLPPGAEILEVTPEPSYVDAGVVYFEGLHGADQEIQLVMDIPAAQMAGEQEVEPRITVPEATATPRILPPLALLPTLWPTPLPSPTPTPAP